MKVNVKNHTMMYPAPAVVATAYDEDGRADACTLAFATMCSHHPPAVMIAINSTLKRKTLKSILQTQEFCLGFPSVEHMAEVDYLGIESGYNADKIAKINFTPVKGEKVNAPIIDEFKVSLECRVMHVAEVGSHTQITGEIVNVQADESVLNDKKIDFRLLDPLAYDDITHSYYKTGDKIADAFKVGLKFK
ncbi:MAG: flavin reductase family protein [Methanobrevibacter thaueri]|jgi:flavin reductase (DIM6/NTAB) family NADH-FMN oxidoreductase RutF|uniref:flavin reductase family protein n=1 Tax=Methanobrevibacter thaueri TaxID=190975 RepID=UPI0026F04D3F|nr:flavin reductase family protein [Methanobrevibacter thaueri]MBE6496045.1 flavin reductase family protein [Methanobrevibacter thaueri]